MIKLKEIMTGLVLATSLIASDINEKELCKDFVYAFDKVDLQKMQNISTKKAYDFFETEVLNTTDQVLQMMIGEQGVKLVSKDKKIKTFLGMMGGIYKIEIEEKHKPDFRDDGIKIYYYKMSPYSESKKPWGQRPIYCSVATINNKSLIVDFAWLTKDSHIPLNDDVQKIEKKIDLSSPKKTISGFLNIQVSELDFLEKYFTEKGYQKYKKKHLKRFRNVAGSMMTEKQISEITLKDILPNGIRQLDGVNKITYYKEKIFGNNAKFKLDVKYNSKLSNIISYSIKLEKVNGNWLISDVKQD